MSKLTSGRTSVLIADKNAHMRRIVRYMLNSLRIKDVYEAQDGGEALEFYEAFQPTILICDWELPMMTGLEIWELLRFQEAGAPAMIMMGDRSRRDCIKKLVDAGIPAYLRKPFSTKDLGERINTLLNRGGMRLTA
ncbi:MAG: response regulator [Pseudomonadota bacterium]